MSCDSAMLTPSASGFAPANGLELYYEIHGSGRPLILLHGGISASEVFGANLVAFAEDRQVRQIRASFAERSDTIRRCL